MEEDNPNRTDQTVNPNTPEGSIWQGHTQANQIPKPQSSATQVTSKNNNKSRKKVILIISFILFIVIVFVGIGVIDYFIIGGGFINKKYFDDSLNIVYVKTLAEYGEEFDCESIGSSQPFETNFPANGKSYKVTYCLGSIEGMTKNTIAVADLNPKDFNLKVDIDGDGTTDEQLEPEEIKIIGL